MGFVNSGDIGKIQAHQRVPCRQLHSFAAAKMAVTTRWLTSRGHVCGLAACCTHGLRPRAQQQSAVWGQVQQPPAVTAACVPLRQLGCHHKLRRAAEVMACPNVLPDQHARGARQTALKCTALSAPAAAPQPGLPRTGRPRCCAGQAPTPASVLGFRVAGQRPGGLLQTPLSPSIEGCAGRPRDTA